MNRNPFNRKKRQFKNLAKQINYLLETDRWEQLAASVKIKLIARLKSYYLLLSNHFTISGVWKTLAAASVFIALPLLSVAQTFNPPKLNPFGYTPPETTLVTPTFADIDDDDDLDLFIGTYDGNIHYFENSGTILSPAFDSAQQNPFGLTNSNYIAFLTNADIDNDGDTDFFVGGTAGSIRYFKNTGTPAAPAFIAPVINPFGYTPSNEFAIPTFADIDNDGDLDLFVTEYSGRMLFYENTGTDEFAHFDAPQPSPFGLTPAYGFGAPVFADLDFDGDLDLLEGEYYGNTRYFENTGTISAPAFAAPITNPFGIVQTVYYAFPAVADLDGDGDFDLAIAEEYGGILYFENSDFNVEIPESEPNVAFSSFPNPASEEVTISLSNNYQNEPVKLWLTDAQGRILEEKAITSQETELDIKHIAPGIYFLKMVCNSKTTCKRLIVN